MKMKDYKKPEIEVLSQYAHLMEVITPGTPKEHFDAPEFHGLESLLGEGRIMTIDAFEEIDNELDNSVLKPQKKSLWDE